MISKEEHTKKVDDIMLNLSLIIKLSLECSQLYSELITDGDRYIYPKSENLLIELRGIIQVELIPELIG